MLVNRIRRVLFGFTWPAFVQWLSRVLLRGGAVAGKSNLHVYQMLRVDSAFDQSYHVSTAGDVSWQRLQTGSSSDAYSTNYSPTPPSVVRAIFSRLPELQDFSFVDLGCGKGRVLIMATEFSFKSVIGIEKVPALYKTACENARIVRHDHPERTEIQLVLNEATAIDFPAGNLVVYLFHPFWKPVMESMVRKIEEALKNESRQLWVVYVNPVFYGLLDASPFLVFDSERSFILPPDDERGQQFIVGIWRAQGGEV